MPREERNAKWCVSPGKRGTFPRWAEIMGDQDLKEKQTMLTTCLLRDKGAKRVGCELVSRYHKLRIRAVIPRPEFDFPTDSLRIYCPKQVKEPGSRLLISWRGWTTKRHVYKEASANNGWTKFSHDLIRNGRESTCSYLLVVKGIISMGNYPINPRFSRRIKWRMFNEHVV